MLPPGLLPRTLSVSLVTATAARAAMLLFSLSESLLLEPSLKERGGLTRLGLGGRLGLQTSILLEVARQLCGNVP